MPVGKDIVDFSRNTLLRNLLSDSTTLHKGLKHAIGSILLDVVYGYEVLPEDDPFVKLAEDTVILTTHAISPGAFLVNVIPSRKFFGWL